MDIFREVNQRIAANAEQYLCNWFPDGTMRRKYYHCKNVERGEKTASMLVNLSSGYWKDLASGDKGGDFVSLYAYKQMLEQKEAAEQLALNLGIETGKKKPAANKKPTERPKAHRVLGEAVAVWGYRDAKGKEKFWVYRFEKDGKKDYRPLHYDGRVWQWQDPPGKLPLYGLDRITANKAAPLLFCEGEKAADAASAYFPDYVTTTTAHGAQSPAKSDFAPVKGRAILIWPDNDEPGRKYAEEIAGLALDCGAKSVHILSIPNDKPAKWDAADADERDNPAKWERVEFVQEEPAITVTGARLSTDITAPSLQALARTNKPPRLFNQEGRLMRLSLVTGKGHSQQIKLIALDSPCLKHELERSARYMRMDRYGNLSHTAPPDIVCADILAMPDYPQFPTLERITTAPCVVKNGEYRVIDRAGYDEHTGLYYFQTEPLTIPDSKPTPAAIRKAKELLDDFLVDFPFADEASRAHALAMLILPFVRDLVRGNTPLHFVTAPSQRTGKSLLVEVVAGVFNPLISASTAPEGRDSDDEWRKKITSALLTESPHIFFDNVKGIIDSANLEAALTSETITARLLGTNRDAVMPNNKVWIATGNNAELSTDMTGRTVEIRLDSNLENPSERKDFKHPNIRQYARDNRAALIGAVLVLARNWIEKKEPAPAENTPYLGGFEGWRRVLGGILHAAEIPGFLQNRAQTVERVNTGDEVFREFVAAWFAYARQNPQRAKDLHPIAKESGVFDEVLSAKDEAAEQKRLGRWISKNVDRIFSGYKIVKAKDGSTGKNAYSLQPLAQTSQLNSFKPLELEIEGNGRKGGKESGVNHTTLESSPHYTPFPPVQNLTPPQNGEVENFGVNGHKYQVFKFDEPVYPTRDSLDVARDDAAVAAGFRSWRECGGRLPAGVEIKEVTAEMN